MLIRVLCLLVFFLTSYSVYANKIVVVVNNDVITSSQLDVRQKMMAELYKIEKKPEMSRAKLKDTSTDMLITERLMFEVSNGANIPEKNLEEYVANDEKGKKLSKGHMKKNFGSKLYKEYLEYVKYQMIWSQFVRNDVMPSVSIFPSDVDNFVIENGGKDINFRFYEITSEKYSKLKNLKEQLGRVKEMRKIKKSSNWEVNEVATSKSKVTSAKWNILRNLGSGDTSNITFDNGEYSMIFVESREVADISDQEKGYVYNIVGNDKVKDMIKQASRFLHKRAYIKKVI